MYSYYPGQQAQRPSRTDELVRWLQQVTDIVSFIGTNSPTSATRTKKTKEATVFRDIAKAVAKANIPDRSTLNYVINSLYTKLPADVNKALDRFFGGSGDAYIGELNESVDRMTKKSAKAGTPVTRPANLPTPATSAASIATPTYQFTTQQREPDIKVVPTVQLTIAKTSAIINMRDKVIRDNDNIVALTDDVDYVISQVSRRVAKVLDLRIKITKVKWLLQDQDVGIGQDITLSLLQELLDQIILIPYIESFDDARVAAIVNSTASLTLSRAISGDSEILQLQTELDTLRSQHPLLFRLSTLYGFDNSTNKIDENIESNPNLSFHQKIGLMFRDHFELNIDNTQPILQLVNTIFSDYDHTMTGDLMRNKPSNVFEIIITLPNGGSLENVMSRAKAAHSTFIIDYIIDDFLNMCDIVVYISDQYPVRLVRVYKANNTNQQLVKLITTGSKEFVTWMRSRARGLNKQLDNTGLHDLDMQASVDVSDSEESIFRQLHVKYLPPVDRN